MSGRHAYRRQVSALWWTTNPAYRFYILREATSFMLLLLSVEFLWALRALILGEADWQLFVEALQHPAAIGINIVILIASLFHAVTWFTLAPKTVNLKIGKKGNTEKYIKRALYIIWFFVSALILGFLWSAN